ncbi:MAG: hypothetical protein PHW69_01955 [Elusimicrobiaceae bacterium]|nr:hypothetical protein [Elusimicrobiaceae bacterium]
MTSAPARGAGGAARLAAFVPLTAIIMLAALFAFSRAGLLRPASRIAVTETAQRKTCLGAQCLRCRCRCFLPEAAAGVCRQRINNGGSVRRAAGGRLDSPAATAPR